MNMHRNAHLMPKGRKGLMSAMVDFILVLGTAAVIMTRVPIWSERL